MSGDGENYFTPERRLQQRREIECQGVVADDFMATDPDCPVFGINLACAYPFPAKIANTYDAMAEGLSKLDEAMYVYPLWETHITILTFINFSLHRRQSPAQMEELQSWSEPIIDVVRAFFDKADLPAFRLELQTPVLSRKAVIIPVLNSTGEISRIRRGIEQALLEKPVLQERFKKAGLNIPGIIHSTILRFKKAPADLARFLAGFDRIVNAMPPLAIPVTELFLTSETRPYMRQGEIIRRFPLRS